MVTYNATTVPLDELLLDPNNFRFRRPGSVNDVAEARFHETRVQAQAIDRIKTDGIAELKRSISENGFVPVERIVVRLIDTPEGSASKYLVIEGNRRTTALKLLQQEQAGGADIPQSVIDVFVDVPVLLAADVTSDDVLAIMGIRHVGGPKEWGGYQSALLIFEMLEDGTLEAREVASRLGLSVREVNRRHQAFTALTQMTSNEDFGDSVIPEMYAIFHEAVGQPAVRTWLGWKVETYQFDHKENRELLYSWMTDVEGNTRKITGYGEVRDLKQILDKPDALTALKDDDQTFADALAIARSEAKAERWLPNAKAALSSLDGMSSQTIESLDEDAVSVLIALKSRATKVLRSHEVSQESDDSGDER
jgi:hypothetical protein